MQIELSSTYSTVIPAQSPNDQRKYEALTLNNGLKLLFVHDSKLQKSACSVSVGIGSLEDPQRSLGLAHFLQHMLFMGSKKYPIHNEYSSFVNQNSGMDNAYTSDTQTNYYFQVASKVFVKAVQRLTNFFTGALLTQSCITKQTQAVHEQYVLWTNDDNCRKWQVLRKLAKAPYNRFTIGNNQTLAHPQIRNDLVKFYQYHYSSNRINAVLCSSLSIEEMKTQLIPFFEQIKNLNLNKPQYNVFYEADNVGKLVRMQSIKEETIMQFFWPIQKLKPFYKKHIDEYITHVLGHQGKHSLFSYLKMRGYASQLTCYHHQIASQSIIGLQVKLTQTGHQNYEEVYNIVIDYTCSLKPESSVFQEIKQKKQVSWMFKQKTQTCHYVCDLSSKMHDFKLQEILNHKYLFEQFDQEYLQKILKQINPFNVIIVYSNSQQLEGAQTQKYLGAKYLIEKLPERKLIVNDFQSLVRNPFLPVDINLKQQNTDKQTPRKISSSIVFLKDNSFKVCKGGVKITLQGMTDPLLRQFYSQYLELLLKQITYDAESLSLQISYQCEDAIKIEIFGFNDTVCKLVEKIGENIIQIHKSENSQQYFTICLDKILEDYENFYCDQVDQICSTTLQNVLINQNIDIAQSIELLQGYEYQSQTDKFLQFLGNCKVSWIFVGNFDQEQCTKLSKTFENRLKSSQSLKNHNIKCLKIQKSLKHLTQLASEQISTSGCIIYYQAGQYTQPLYYTLQLLKNHIQEPFFNQLRTQRQLAYYLSTKIKNTRGVLGMYFILVSSSKDPEYISREIKKFVSEFMSKMTVQLTQEKIHQLKQSVKTRFIVPHNNLKECFDFICHQLQSSTFYFTRKSKQELDRHLNAITKDDLIKTWGEIGNKALQIQVLAKNHEQQFRKLQNSSTYTKFDKIKKGKYHQDVISKRASLF